MKSWMKGLLAGALGLLLPWGDGAAAGAATVTDVVARQRYPWNGLVDITCTVEGIEGETEGLKFVVAAVEGARKVRRGTHVWVVRDGVESEDLTAQENGTYELVWDARTDLGEGLWSNLVVRVTVDAHNGVQLWEGGPLWAETNIGAEEPWEYGLYFWWGDTVGYRRGDGVWVASDGSSENFSFQSSIVSTNYRDNVLLPEEDAAQVHWGGGWRMPTAAEFTNLLAKTTTSWITNNGVGGRLVTGKGDYASASIFLPAAGRATGTSLYRAGSNGYGFVWSSTPYTGNSYSAYYLFFSWGNRYLGSWQRYYGFPVRPVRGCAE